MCAELGSLKKNEKFVQKILQIKKFRLSLHLGWELDLPM